MRVLICLANPVSWWQVFKGWRVHVYCMRYRDNLPLVTTNLSRMVYMVAAGVVLQDYMKTELGASLFEISLIESMFWLALLIFSPLWGASSDASGRRKPFLLVSILAAALVFPLFTLAESPYTVLALRFLFAALASAFPPAALAAMSVHAETEDRGKRIAPYHMSRGVGFLLGWGGAGIVLDLLGFHNTFYALAGVGVVGFLIGTRITGIDTPEPVSLGEVWRKARERWIPSWHDGALHVRGLPYLYAAIFLRKMGLIGLFSLIVVYAVHELGFSRSLTGLLLALNPVGQLIAIELFSMLADRTGRRHVFVLGFLSSVPVPLLLIVAGHPAIFGLTYLLVGVSFAAILAGTTTFIGDVAPDDRQGEFMGIRKSAQGLAGFLGPLVAGTVATFYGYTAMFVVMAGIMALGFLAAWLGTEESLDHVSGHGLGHDAYDIVGGAVRRARKQ